MVRRLTRACTAVVLCGILAPVPSARAEAAVSFVMRQLPGEWLPAFVAALDAASTLTQTPDGRTCVQLNVDGGDATRGLAELRFENGDELVRIDKTAIRTTASARAVLRDKRPGDDVTFLVQRAGALQAIAFEILPTAVPSADQTAVPASDAAPNQNAPAAADESVPGVIAVSSAELERELARYDPLELVAAAELEMVRDNAGNVTGIGSPRFGDIALSRMVGLRNGDVVLGVNGMPVTSEAAIFEIADRLQGQTQFTANVLRGGLHVVVRVRVY